MDETKELKERFDKLKDASYTHTYHWIELCRDCIERIDRLEVLIDRQTEWTRRSMNRIYELESKIKEGT